MIPGLQQKLNGLPDDPGCYLMKNRDGKIIYVGKAKDLRARVSSYFRGDHPIKTTALVREIRDLDVMLTKTEGEALLLERTLIRHHKPHFNILLQDDKEFPIVRVDINSDWPRFSKVRRRKDDGAIYLGPFPSASTLRSAMQLMYRVFPLIRCSPHEFANTRRPCNYYHMKMCLAPCTLPVPRGDYVTMVKDAIAFLEGKDRQLMAGLKDRMMLAAEQENFELAATLRDQLQSLSSIIERQAVVFDPTISGDAVGVFHGTEHFAVHILHVQRGQVTGGSSFVLPLGLHGPLEDFIEFAIQYYDPQRLPGTILCPAHLIDEPTRLLLQEFLKDADVRVPQRGVLVQAVELANKNAHFNLQEFQQDHVKKQTVLDLIRDTLKLPRPPRRIECIDISNFQGDSIVASNVCFIDTKPSKDHYRHYNVRSLVDGNPDDFASMSEVVTRRMERGIRDGDMPDLLVVDGGRGQLNAALDARAKFPGIQLPMVGLAKSRAESEFGKRKFSDGPKYSDERIFQENVEAPLPLEVGSPLYRLFTHLRDEAHRFAISFHRKRRDKKTLTSSLDHIPGIGPTLRKKLFATFGDMDGLRRASLDQLRAVKGLKESAAVALHAALHSDTNDAK